MSFYNAMHGFDPAAITILRLLKIDLQAIPFPRFRDAYFDWKDETNNIPKIVILTRTGGGNRENYSDANAWIQQIPGFISDADDEFDSTFALWSIDVPEKFVEQAAAYLTATGKPLTLREKTMRACDLIGKGAEPIPEVIMNALEPLLKAIKS